MGLKQTQTPEKETPSDAQEVATLTGERLSKPDITALLQQWHQSHSQALEQLIPHVYQDLQRMARFYFRRGNQQRSLQATELVHEVFLQLQASSPPIFENRDHFFSCVGMMMRQILMRYARARNALKRGGNVEKVPFDDQLRIAFPGLAVEQMMVLDDFLQELGDRDPRKLRILEWQFFLGLTTSEIAEILGLSERSVQREVRFARGWLARALRRPETRAPDAKVRQRALDG
ncbi:ECF-type sigma factor [Acanthopleuribacter pedis]|uniref:Sigma-70 family RNA polymerase sigma factor n=1 Tax=Acanthopleuribacter pedis TaxID=442870 RepID=A0A8J7U553_9BACT|nr:ECF-type sigma factor [Acanthopleuribacter pedis]MBO1320128.1 sigma-70 family RNA polymerase sigma factor [Acanthopleuribacter pedis]